MGYVFFSIIWYGWLIFGTQLVDRQSIRLCFDYNMCGDLQLFAILFLIPPFLFLVGRGLRNVWEA